MDLDALRPFLPPVALELAKLIGWEAFAELVKAKGGVWVKVPRVAGKGGVLAEIVGDEAEAVQAVMDAVQDHAHKFDDEIGC